VAHYEFIWAQQLWGLTNASRPYIQHYLEHYVLPDGNFTYNTQDQVEAPLNVGIFLMNAARDYWYTRDASGLLQQQPVLERMLGYVLARYEYGKQRFAKSDRRYGLIWGSPEATWVIQRTIIPIRIRTTTRTRLASGAASQSMRRR
jgi:hypothetical protein